MIRQGTSYYGIKKDYYDAVTNHSFTALTLEGGTVPNNRDILMCSFPSMATLSTSMTKGSDTFKPIDKLANSFEVMLYKSV